MKHSPIARVLSALRASAHKDAREWRRYSILFLAFVLLMALLYTGVGHVVRQQRQDYAALTTELFSSQASAMFQELELVSNAILRNGTVFALAKDENPIIDRLEICDAMKGCMITSEYAEHAYLFPAGDGDIYTDEGIYSGNSRATLLGQAGAREEDLFNDGDDAAFHVLNDNHMAPFAVTCVRSREGDVTSSLVVTMHMSQFMRMFQNIDAEMCTVFNDRVYISSYIKAIDDPDFSWRDEKAIGRLLGKPVTCFYLEGDGYTYMVAIDQARFNRPLNMLLIGFCAFTFILVLLGMVHVYHSIKRRRTEIDKVLAVLPESYQGDQSYEQIYTNIRKSLEDYRTQQADYLREQNR